MSSNTIDATPFFEARAARRRQPAAPTFHVLMLRDMSVGELVNALRGTGLTISTQHGQTVLHRQPTNEGNT